MKTFRLSLATLAFALCANVATAQETPQQKADKQTQKLTQELQLTSSQQAQVAEINLAIAQKNDAVKNDQNMSQETKQQSYTGNNDARIQMIKSVLTAEQSAKFDKMQQDKGDRGEIQKSKFTPDLSQFKTAPQTIEPVKE